MIEDTEWREQTSDEYIAGRLERMTKEELIKLIYELRDYIEDKRKQNNA